MSDFPKLRGFRARVIHVITSPYRFFKFMCFSVGFAVIAVTAGVAIYVASAYRELPRLAQMDFKDVKSLAVQRVDAQLEGRAHPARWVELKDVSRDYLYSMVMSEDSTFFEHNGFNVDAMIDSLAEDLRQR
jgi:monofunctional biosynthetic peptidoglycan transglycosylase